MRDPPLHDPLALAYVLQPSMFVAEKYRVDVELSGGCAGRTLVDLYKMSQEPANVVVATECNIDEFWKLFCEAMSEIAKRY